MLILRRQRKTICFPRLDAASARSIGEIAINMALRRGQAISVCVANRSRTLYLCALDGSECTDQGDLQKCMQTALRFEQSSLEVGLRLRRSKRLSKADKGTLSWRKIRLMGNSPESGVSRMSARRGYLSRGLSNGSRSGIAHRRTIHDPARSPSSFAAR
ncbi:heme-binding protein [Caballeronia pedi]|uniref:heme-binding protein n=1 Tax=Caballeronia pedi TaxID=1777141 RepID=UPI000B35D054